MPTRQRRCRQCRKLFFLNSPTQWMCSKRCSSEKHKKCNTLPDSIDQYILRAIYKDSDDAFKRAIKEGRFEDAAFHQKPIPIRKARRKSLHVLRE